MKRAHEHFNGRGIGQREFCGGRIAAYKLAIAAGLRGLYAEQPDIIHNAVLKRRVGVKRALVVGDREPCPLAQRLARVAHAVEPHTGDVLLHRFAQDLADGPVDRKLAFERQPLFGQPVHDRESAAVFERVGDRREVARPGEPVVLIDARFDERDGPARECAGQFKQPRRAPRWK